MLLIYFAQLCEREKQRESDIVDELDPSLA